MRESVVESADSAVESADYWSRSTGNWPSGYGPLSWGLRQGRIMNLKKITQQNCLKTCFLNKCEKCCPQI